MHQAPKPYQPGLKKIENTLGAKPVELAVPIHLVSPAELQSDEQKVTPTKTQEQLRQMRIIANETVSPRAVNLEKPAIPMIPNNKETDFDLEINNSSMENNAERSPVDEEENFSFSHVSEISEPKEK